LRKKHTTVAAQATRDAEHVVMVTHQKIAIRT